MQIDVGLPSPRSASISIQAGQGSIVALGDVTNSVLSILNRAEGDNFETATRLAALTREVLTSTELDRGQKQQMIESLEFITKQIAAKPDQREKPSVIRAVWTGMLEMLTISSNLATIYAAAAPFLHRFTSAF